MSTPYVEPIPTPYVSPTVEFISDRLDAMKLQEKMAQKLRPSTFGEVRVRRPTDVRKFTITSTHPFEVDFLNTDLTLLNTKPFKSIREISRHTCLSDSVIYKSEYLPKASPRGHLIRLRKIPILMTLTIQEPDGTINTYDAQVACVRDLGTARKSLSEVSGIPLSRINAVYRLYSSLSDSEPSEPVSSSGSGNPSSSSVPDGMSASI